MLQYINTIDGNILFFIQEHMRNPILTPFFQFVTCIGDKGMIWIIIAVILVCFKKSRKTGAVILITLMLSFIINNEILKHVIARPRPFTTLDNLKILISKPTDFSFPSGHTASSFAAAGSICFYGNKKWSVPAFILAALIGFSRLYLGVHYPSDVIFGILSGLILSFIVSKLLICWQMKTASKASIS
jgi:Membrane-associated phospholipid phosphatase